MLLPGVATSRLLLFRWGGGLFFDNSRSHPYIPRFGRDNTGGAEILLLTVYGNGKSRRKTMPKAIYRA